MDGNGNGNRRRSPLMQRRLLRRQSVLNDFLRRRLADAELANAETNMEEELHHPTPLPPLPDELYDLIFISLPAKSLLRLQLVCKNWFTLINRPFFIQAHAHQFETLLVSNCPISRRSQQRFWFHFLSLEDGSSSFVDESEPVYKVQASCDGLILAYYKSGLSLRLLNPLTRQKIELLNKCIHPDPIQDPIQESFGVAYCSEAKSYKVVRVFRRGCEILTVRSREWRTIEGPDRGCILFSKASVSIGGSLHWLSISKGELYCASMNVCDEKFVSTRLPATGAGGDKLVEIGGDLGYVPLAEMNNQLQIWIMIGGCWTKRYSIRPSVACMPICCRRKGKEMVLESLDGHRLYVYDLESDELKQVMSPGCDDEQQGIWNIYGFFFPHRNTLVSIV